jgi:hypothetical protein
VGLGDLKVGLGDLNVGLGDLGGTWLLRIGTCVRGNLSELKKVLQLLTSEFSLES